MADDLVSICCPSALASYKILLAASEFSLSSTHPSDSSTFHLTGFLYVLYRKLTRVFTIERVAIQRCGEGIPSASLELAAHHSVARAVS